MANKYCNLYGENKICDDYDKINVGFAGVETDVTLVLTSEPEREAAETQRQVNEELRKLRYANTKHYGTYVDTFVYHTNNIVDLNGSSFMLKEASDGSILESQGNPPPTYPLEENDYWRLVGKKGDKGDTGTVPNIQVGTVTTLQPGNPVSVARQPGSPDEAPVFDFAIPKGTDGTGVGDMTKADYDKNNNGIVDDSEKLGGNIPAYFAKAQDVTVLQDKINQSKTLNVRTYGAVGDWNGTTGTDDTQAFINCFAAASALGGANIIAEGRFKVTQNLTLPIKCTLDGKNRTSELCFVGENIGLILASDGFMSNCYPKHLTISYKAVDTQVVNNNIAIYMGTSHVNSIEDVLITGFYRPIYGNVAQLNKINNVYVIGCKRGIEFENVSYVNVIENSTITGVETAIIAGPDSHIIMKHTDIEAITNVGIQVIGSIDMSDIHIESGNPAILLDGNGAQCTGENIKITFPSTPPGDPVRDGIKQSENCINGSFSFKNIKFAGISGYEFNCPTLSNYTIEDVSYKTAAGGAKTPNIILPEKGILLNRLYNDTAYRYNMERGIFSIKGNDVIYKKQKAFTKTIDFGTIEAQSTAEFVIITTNESSPFNVDFYTEKAEKTFINSTPPAGIMVEAWITANATNSITIRATNIKSTPVVTGSLTLGLAITNL
jgi:hypothetical protein